MKLNFKQNLRKLYNKMFNQPHPYPPMEGPGMGPDFGAPDMKGKWTNRRTGQVVIVRDTVIMDDSMVVMLSDGSMIDMGEFSRDYIQMSEEIYDLAGNVIGREPMHDPHHGPIHEHHHGPHPMPGIPSAQHPGHHHAPDHRPIPPMPGPKPHKPAYKPVHKPHAMKPMRPVMPARPIRPLKPQKPVSKPVPKPYDKLEALIRDVFTKINPAIDIDLKLVSEDFPKDELKMLINIFGVSYDKISQYILKNYIKDSMIVDAIKEFVKEQIPEDAEEPTEPEEPEEPVKKPCHCGDGSDVSCDCPPYTGDSQKPCDCCQCEKKDDEFDPNEDPENPLDPGFTIDPNDGLYYTLPDGTTYCAEEYDEEGHPIFTDNDGNERWVEEDEELNTTYFYYYKDGELKYDMLDSEGNWFTDEDFNNEEPPIDPEDPIEETYYTLPDGTQYLVEGMDDEGHPTFTDSKGRLRWVATDNKGGTYVYYNGDNGELFYEYQNDKGEWFFGEEVELDD